MIGLNWKDDVKKWDRKHSDGGDQVLPTVLPTGRTDTTPSNLKRNEEQHAEENSEGVVHEQICWTIPMYTLREPSEFQSERSK